MESKALTVYLAAEDVDLERLRRYFEVKLWIAGFGFVAFARNGAMLNRTIVDLSVLSPERLVYEARPILGPGLAQEPRLWTHREGAVLTGDLQLTDAEVAEFNRLVDAARRDTQNVAEAERLQDEYRAARIDDVIRTAGFSQQEAERRIPRQSLVDREASSQVLPLDLLVEIRGEHITIQQLMERGEEFDKAAMPDPIEGRAYGATTAKFYWNGGRDPCISSFAHGLRTKYWLGQSNDFAIIEPTTSIAVVNTNLASVDPAQPLEPSSFPHRRPSKSGGHSVLATIENVQHLFREYGIHVRYNLIKKKIEISGRQHFGSPENFDNTAMSRIVSLANLNGMPTSHIPEFVAALADANPHNPFASWVQSRPWDGVDRMPQYYDTLKIPQDYPPHLRNTLVYRWHLSVIAAAFSPTGFRARGVLTLQGPQGIGKTTWLHNLITDPKLRDDIVLLGHHLDPSNKDSATTALSHLIVELGELDSSFKKDIARLKSFITGTTDKIRRPYARTDSEYPRRTVFCATVNEANFLVDLTGNTRFWVIPVVGVDLDHNLDMQQIWAQMLVEYQRGAQWWLTTEEEAQLEASNREYQAVSAIKETLEAALKPDMPDAEWEAYTATEVLKVLGFDHPTNAQARECGAFLRQLYGEPRKIRGVKKWRLPLPKPMFPR